MSYVVYLLTIFMSYRSYICLVKLAKWYDGKARLEAKKTNRGQNNNKKIEKKKKQMLFNSGT